MKAFPQQLIKKYTQGDNYKYLYTWIKMYCLIEELYHSDSISQDEKKQEQQQIISRYSSVKATFQPEDIRIFVKHYQIQQQYRKIESHKGTHVSVEQIVARLTQSAIQIQDMIAYDDEKNPMKVSQIVNNLFELTIILTEYKNAKRINDPKFNEIQKKITQKYDQLKIQNPMNIVPQKNLAIINQSITQLRYYYRGDK